LREQNQGCDAGDECRQHPANPHGRVGGTNFALVFTIRQSVAGVGFYQEATIPQSLAVEISDYHSRSMEGIIRFADEPIPRLPVVLRVRFVVLGAAFLAFGWLVKGPW
jgi:hypothetical protein